MCDFLKFSENEYTTCPYLWETTEAVLNEDNNIKCLHEKLERFHINNLTEHMNALEQKEVIRLESSRQQEIIKQGTEINKRETKRIIQKKINK